MKDEAAKKAYDQLLKQIKADCKKRERHPVRDLLLSPFKGISNVAKWIFSAIKLRTLPKDVRMQVMAEALQEEKNATKLHAVPKQEHEIVAECKQKILEQEDISDTQKVTLACHLSRHSDQSFLLYTEKGLFAIQKQGESAIAVFYGQPTITDPDKEPLYKLREVGGFNYHEGEKNPYSISTQEIKEILANDKLSMVQPDKTLRDIRYTDVTFKGARTAIHEPENTKNVNIEAPDELIIESEIPEEPEILEEQEVPTDLEPSEELSEEYEEYEESEPIELSDIIPEDELEEFEEAEIPDYVLEGYEDEEERAYYEALSQGLLVMGEDIEVTPKEENHENIEFSVPNNEIKNPTLAFRSTYEEEPVKEAPKKKSRSRDDDMER